MPNRRNESPSATNAFSFVLFRAFGIQFEMNVTFIVLFAWVVISLYRRGHDLHMALYGFALLAVAFGCIFVHEIGHVLVSRAFRIRTSEITLTAIGGHARLERVPDKPAQEMLIALSGPSVNLAMGTAVFLYLHTFGNVPSPEPFTNLEANALGQFMWLNFALGLSNLVPLFPLDGGRVLRAFVGFFTDYPRATKFVSWFSRAMTIPIAIYGMHGQPIYLLFAVWIWLGSRAANEDARNRYALKPFTARDVMVTQFDSLPIGASLRDATAKFISTFQEEFPVMNGSEVVGMLSFKNLTDAIDAHGIDVTIGRAMHVDFETIRADDSLEDVLKNLDEQKEQVALVKDKDAIVGLVPMSNLKELVRVQRALDVV
ncbi:MAG: site-2 protease family protein [Myxococcaceae bacterium]